MSEFKPGDKIVWIGGTDPSDMPWPEHIGRIATVDYATNGLVFAMNCPVNLTNGWFERRWRLATPADLAPVKEIEKVEEVDGVDLVNQPPHYTSHPSGVECIQITEHMGFTLGNAIKYIWRADLKGNSVEDLEKAAWYVQREIERRKNA